MKGDKLAQCQKCGKEAPILYLVGNPNKESKWLMVCGECKEKDNDKT